MTIARANPITIYWCRLLPGGHWIAIERHLYAGRERAYWLVEPQNKDL